MELSKHWLVMKSESGQHENADWIINASSTSPIPATVPGTVAQLLLDSPPQSLESLSDLAQFDWWYATEFDLKKTDATYTLIFDGLATLTDIWLNGKKILSTNNMFLQYQVHVSAKVKEKNQLVICFRSVSHALEAYKKRPRWKTKLVEHQQIRWIRTTLLGHIVGWTPPIQPIGPWQKIRLESADTPRLKEYNLQAFFNSPHGSVKIKAKLEYDSTQSCEVFFEINHIKHLLFSGTMQEIQLTAEIPVPQVQAWAPHTHGIPHLYEYSLYVQAGHNRYPLREGKIGFRDVTLNQDNGLFQVQVNGIKVFARGAVWTVNDFVSLTGNLEDLRSALTLAREAGMNMLRIGGTMIYEQDEFYNVCDQLGIMVWQDFMFANMDYPIGDETFHENITAEAAYQLKRLSQHPCVVIYCGNSEVEQQAAMLGIPSDMWRNAWFASELPELVKSLHENTIYVPSSPSGGILPFHPGDGVAHYYGVGAYRRDIHDVRRSNVKFAAECLGFSNVPENKILWKSGIPKDNGAEWDFEDVRDHYLLDLFGIDPTELKATNMDRYLMLSRIASGEIMSQVFSEWRSTNSNCSGGLLWFYKDLLAGAGWGILDSDNNPKAAYYFLKRILQPVSLTLTDEGLQGLYIHLINEKPAPFTGTVEFQMLQAGNITIAKGGREITLSANESSSLSAEELLGGFYDTSYAYRFGPPKHEVTCATLRSDNGEIVSQQFHFPLKKEVAHVTASVETDVIRLADGGCQLSIRSDHFLYAIQIECEGFLPEDNYFHLMPDERRIIKLHPVKKTGQELKIHIRSVNLQGTITLPFKTDSV